MKLTKTTAAKATFSLIGVACLVLAGVTGYNYARTMEAYTVVSLEPEDVSVAQWGSIVSINITYALDNPSRIAIELIWAKALVRLFDDGREYDFENYKGFSPGDMRLEPGESATFVMSGHAKLSRSSDAERYWGVLNRSSDADWGVFCSMFYTAVEFEFSNYRYDAAYFLRED